jgi:hypothetical protein
MNSFIARTARLLAVGTLIAAGTLVPATAAQAKPTGCSGDLVGLTYYARCISGLGWYRAYIDCYRIGTNRYTPRTGRWIPSTVGVNSIASCQSNEEPGTRFAELRD